MTHVVAYFQVHQPWRLRRLSWLEQRPGTDCIDTALNRRILRKVAARCYLPATRLLERMVKASGGAFRCAFSLSGTALDQLQRHAPAALEAFQRLAATGAVEFLAETSHHSLAALADSAEFEAQVQAHAARIEALMGRRPTTFRNTELIISREVAAAAARLGFTALLGEGAERLLGGRPATTPYRVPGAPGLRLLLRSYRLSDDIAFRFADRGWSQWPLDAATFAGWLAAAAPLPAGGPEPMVGLFMDYETLGEHQDAATGILAFLEALPAQVARHPHLAFRTPSEVARAARRAPPLALGEPVSWADQERDLSAWLGNHMQQAAHAALYDLLPAVRARGDARLLEDWRRLSTSDHTYYMSTKHLADGDIHRYFSPYPSPHEAYVTYMDALDHLAVRVGATRPRPAARRA
ncbi:MAG: glycoside hydrolase family 57 protein [Planctomycetia bacterium]